MARPKKTKLEKEEEARLKKLGLKLCHECGKTLDIGSFPDHEKSKGTKRRQCSDCYKVKRANTRKKNPEADRKSKRDYYQRNKDKIIQKNSEYAKLNKDKVKTWSKRFKKKKQKEFQEFKKTLKCSICGYDKNPKAIDLHHVDPSKKYKLTSRLIGCTNKLKEELEKCVPICSNCHREIHND